MLKDDCCAFKNETPLPNVKLTTQSKPLLLTVSMSSSVYIEALIVLLLLLLL